MLTEARVYLAANQAESAQESIDLLSTFTDVEGVPEFVQNYSSEFSNDEFAAWSQVLLAELNSESMEEAMVAMGGGAAAGFAVGGPPGALAGMVIGILALKARNLYRGLDGANQAYAAGLNTQSSEQSSVDAAFLALDVIPILGGVGRGIRVIGPQRLGLLFKESTPQLVRQQISRDFVNEVVLWGGAPLTAASLGVLGGPLAARYSEIQSIEDPVERENAERVFFDEMGTMIIPLTSMMLIGGGLVLANSRPISGAIEPGAIPAPLFGLGAPGALSALDDGLTVRFGPDRGPTSGATDLGLSDPSLRFGIDEASDVSRIADGSVPPAVNGVGGTSGVAPEVARHYEAGEPSSTTLSDLRSDLSAVADGARAGVSDRSVPMAAAGTRFIDQFFGTGAQPRSLVVSRLSGSGVLAEDVAGVSPRVGVALANAFDGPHSSIDAFGAANVDHLSTVFEGVLRLRSQELGRPLTQAEFDRLAVETVLTDATGKGRTVDELASMPTAPLLDDSGHSIGNTGGAFWEQMLSRNPDAPPFLAGTLIHGIPAFETVATVARRAGMDESVIPEIYASVLGHHISVFVDNGFHQA
ncbi:MAG: hypothetical protein AAF658_13975, partial [Myxococcota bacterium]